MGLTTGRVPAGARTYGPARRLVLRVAFAVTVATGTAGVLAPVLTTSPGAGVRTGRGAGRTGTGSGKSGAPEPEWFAETYHGRHIQGTVAPVVRTGAGDTSLPGITVRIDGRPLHVMRRADGGYLSTVVHYESFPTLLETARAAVDELGPAQLSLVSPHSI